jgi:hypothetical protein
MSEGVTIKDTDHGYKALIERVFGFAKPTISVGILEADGDKPHGDDDVTILMVAIWNEFGTSRIPARSFIREWFDESEAELRVALTEGMKRVVAGQITKEQLLEQLAQKAVGDIQARMASSIPPPNAPSTAARKKSTTTLENTGALRGSISYRIDEGT